MLRKIILGIGAAGTAIAMLPLLAAFEAHVVNVTARIENALSVSPDNIDFGTVFPQEHLNKPLNVQLSGSFMTENRVDDVNYFIRQKPKCGWTLKEGTNLLGLPTYTGHVVVNPQTGVAEVECPDPGNPLRPAGAVYGVLPSLCEYISKEADEGGNDTSTPSFHHPWKILPGIGTSTPGAGEYYLVWNDTLGRLAKSENDESDDWVIDLSVPCFGGYCAQDWEDFVHGINPNAEPSEFTQSIGNEHKVFGCDLWIEVTEVSRDIDQS